MHSLKTTERNDMLGALGHRGEVLKELRRSAYVNTGLALDYRRAADA
ncbi:MAG: hypothetical protein OXR67_01755 [Chloroflexota bacterium]|nr:hypothetical protein [Chloroflexota bacterium]